MRRAHPWGGRAAKGPAGALATGWPGAGRAAGWAAATASVLGLCGCALLPDSGAARDAALSIVSPAAAPPVRLEVDAPAPLKELLENHLDLARMARVGGADALSTAEIDRLVATTPAQARALAETEGYFDAQVQARRDDGTPPRVRVTLVPGPQAVVGRVDVVFEGDIERLRDGGDAAAQALAARLAGGWPLRAGQPFRNPAWGAAKGALLAQLRSAGYPAAALSGTTAEVDVASGRVRLYVVADSGPLFRTGALRIEGLERQDDTTVRRLAGFGPGTPATEALLLDYQERLLAAGLYDRATVTLDTDPARAAAADVVIRVNELPLQTATVGVGIDADTGPRVSLEHTHRRVAGQRATLVNKLELGRNRQAWDADLTTHAETDFHRNLAGARWERLLSENDTVVSQRLRLGRERDTDRIDRLTFIEAERSQRSVVDAAAQSREDRLALSLNQHVIWRRLDSLLLPTEGVSVSLETGLGLARGSDGRTGPFGRLHGRVTGYLPFGDAWFGKARIELGQVFSRSDTAVPDSQRFRAGGDESVRGYAYRSLAPLDNGVVGSGRLVFTASVEVARPVSARLPQIWGAAFIDAGRAADDWAGLKPALGAGVGLRWRSPVGPLRIDVAYGEEVRAWRTHLTVGVTY